MPTDAQSETPPRHSVENGEAQRDDWVAAVEPIISDAEAWATEQHWFVHRSPKTITEDDVGSYEVPTLLIRAPAGRFTLRADGPLHHRRHGGWPLRRRRHGRDRIERIPFVRVRPHCPDRAGWHFVIKRPDLDRLWSKEAFLEIAAELARKA